MSEIKRGRSTVQALQAESILRRYYADSSSLATSMASLQDQSGRADSTSNPEPPPWTQEVAASLATRPSRASSLVSTRTKFSTTTFQEDAKSIDLSISGQHFRISRDGSKVTSINPAELLPPYPFSPLQVSSQHDSSHYRHVGSTPENENDLSNEPIGDFVESQASLDQNNLASSTTYVDPGKSGSNDAEFSFPVPSSDIPQHSGASEHGVSNSSSGLGGPPDKTNTLSSMAVRIQRAWRNYVRYRSPTANSSEPTSSMAGAIDQQQTVALNGSTHFTTAAVRQQATTGPQLHRAGDVPIPVPNKSMSFRDKELPIPDEAETVPVRDSGLSFFTSLSRRPEARDVDRSSLVATSSRPPNLGLARIDSSNAPSISLLSNKAFFPGPDGRESTEQLSLRKWFTGEDIRPFRDTDGPDQTPVVTQPPETMDSENDVSNHYTRMIRFIDRDHRRALHARDTDMAKLRERLNEQDIVYRQELRGRDFLIEDLKKRLDHVEEKTEAEIERARNVVEDVWESRWKDRDFHLRERMQRMESEMQKTMEMTIAEREAAWSAKYEKLRRTLEASEGSLDD